MRESCSTRGERQMFYFPAAIRVCLCALLQLTEVIMVYSLLRTRLLRKMAGTKMMCSLVLLSLIVTVMSAPKECIKNQSQCVHNKECCDGCCSEGKCTSHADGCSIQLNPCSLHYCGSGKTCYLQQVACVSANCDPVPACKDPDYDYEE